MHKFINFLKIIFIVILQFNISKISYSDVIKNFEIKGNDRVSKETILMFSNLEIGDIISEVNRETIYDVSSFINLVSQLEKTGRSSLLLKIIRNDEQKWVTIRFNN